VILRLVILLLRRALWLMVGAVLYPLLGSRRARWVMRALRLTRRLTRM
jgi:hypothetical protein